MGWNGRIEKLARVARRSGTFAGAKARPDWACWERARILRAYRSPDLAYIVKKRQVVEEEGESSRKWEDAWIEP